MSKREGGIRDYKKFSAMSESIPLNKNRRFSEHTKQTERSFQSIKEIMDIEGHNDIENADQLEQ
jgi:hypothetical protein